MEEHEKWYILEVLDEVEGNKSKAATILKIDLVSLWRKIKRYNFDGLWVTSLLLPELRSSQPRSLPIDGERGCATQVHWDSSFQLEPILLVLRADFYNPMVIFGYSPSISPNWKGCMVFKDRF